MSEYLIQSGTLEAIANAIREKNGSTTTYTPAEIAQAIRALNGGRENLAWHQCPEAVRSYLAAAAAAYSDTNVTVIDQYAHEKGSQVVADTKPIGYTIDGVTFRDNQPLVATPFATANKAGTLTALDKLRWINTTPAEAAAGSSYPRGANCRDLGGWDCDGGTIKYGMLIRGGEPNPADKNLMVNQIGIKTEVQLLPTSEQADDYKMKSVWCIDWAGNDTESASVYTLSDSKELWKKLLEPIMDSVIHSKGVYFHCGIGADRTGMIAAALEGLLGVSRANIDMEYELTNFSTGWQSLAGGIYRSRTYTAYKALMTQQSNVPLLYGLTNTFRNRWISFVLSCGIGIDKINAFRAACIDGTPDVITINVPTYTVTNNLTSVNNSNATTSMEEYQQYIATLTPSSGKLIDSVRVTMGGTDITSQVFSGTTATMLVYVEQNLTNCASSYSREVAEAGTAFTTTLTADTGYTLNSVTITMGGEDMSQYYSGGIINIPSVTGNIVITATAVESVKENLLTMNDGLINKRFNATNTVSNVKGYFITDYFAYSGGGLRIVKGNINMGSLGTTNYGNCRIGFYDANKTFIDAAYIGRNDGTGTNKYLGFIADGDDLVDADLATYTGIADWSAVKFIRMTLALNNETTIASVDEVLNSGMKIYAE